MMEVRGESVYWGRNDLVTTQSDLEKKLSKPVLGPKSGGVKAPM